MRANRIFAGIEPEKVDEMLRCFDAAVRRFSPGASIVQYSGALEHVCVVLSGTAEISCMDAEGNVNLVETLEPDAVFGELFSLPMRAMVYAVTARTACEVLFLRHGRIVQRCGKMCAEHDRLINNLFELSARRSQALSRRIAILSRRTLRQKLMLYLDCMAAETGASAFELPMPLSELADYLCADRSAMMRELGRMRGEGLIRSSGRRFELLAAREERRPG